MKVRKNNFNWCPSTGYSMSEFRVQCPSTGAKTWVKKFDLISIIYAKTKEIFYRTKLFVGIKGLA